MSILYFKRHRISVSNLLLTIQQDRTHLEKERSKICGAFSRRKFSILSMGYENFHQSQGRAGAHRLKKLFQERGIPPWLRDRVPLIYKHDQLVEVVGLCLCDLLL
jgi:tRNA(Ile)-lysidine synthetase-like protein